MSVAVDGAAGGCRESGTRDTDRDPSVSPDRTSRQDGRGGLGSVRAGLRVVRKRFFSNSVVRSVILLWDPSSSG